MKSVVLKKIQAVVAVFLGVSLFVITLALPDVVKDGVLKGLLICGEIIIPSLFPLTVIALFLFKSGCLQLICKLISPITNKLLRLQGQEFLVFIMSIIGGYPVGGRLVSDLYAEKQVSQNTAARLLYCGVNGGPAFIVIAVGSGIFGSKTIGWLLLSTHIFASILICIFTRSLSRGDEKSFKKTLCDKNQIGISDSFVLSTAQGAASVLSICGWVVLFSAFCNIISQSSGSIGKLLSLPLEVTNAVLFAHELKLPLFVIAFLIGWSGLSVQFQIISSLDKLKVSLTKFMIARFSHGLISSVLFYLITLLFPQTINVVSIGSSNGSVISYGNSFFLSTAIVFMCIVFMAFFKQNSLKSCRKTT